MIVIVPLLSHTRTVLRGNRKFAGNVVQLNVVEITTQYTGTIFFQLQLALDFVIVSLINLACSKFKITHVRVCTYLSSVYFRV